MKVILGFLLLGLTTLGLHGQVRCSLAAEAVAQTKGER